MIKVLFICHGSICRSPMAEFTLKHMVATRGRASGFHIASAATSTEEIGNPIHHGTMAIFRKYHIPCTGHRAVQMKKSDYDAYDYIIGMDNANIRNILRIVGSTRSTKYISCWSLPAAPARSPTRGTREILRPPTEMSAKAVRPFWNI